MGELNKVGDLGYSSARYDVNTTHHPHLYCDNCHKVKDVEQDLDSSELLDKNHTGF